MIIIAILIGIIVCIFKKECQDTFKSKIHQRNEDTGPGVMTENLTERPTERLDSQSPVMLQDVVVPRPVSVFVAPQKDEDSIEENPAADSTFKQSTEIINVTSEPPLVESPSVQESEKVSPAKKNQDTFPPTQIIMVQPSARLPSNVTGPIVVKPMVQNVL